MTTTNVWSLVLTVFAFHNQLFFSVITLSHVANGLSISPPSEEIFSNQLCPDPTTKAASTSPDSSSGTLGTWNSWWPPRSGASQPLLPQKILAINLDKPKDSTHFYESCTFKEQWEPGPVTGESPRLKHNVRVRSINLNVNSWNFSTSQNCSTFIKFNNWDDHDGGRYPVLCGRENFDQYLGPYGHPMVLYYQWKKGGLSFPLFHSSYGEHHRDRKETLELQYMQIYFFVTSGSKGDTNRKCRVQQYRLDWLRMGCSSYSTEEEPVCGEYPCPELEALYQSKMTIFKDGESENDTVLVWKTKNDKYRMRTFLRQKFVPVVFLIVLICAYRSYMKAGLRYQNSIQDDMPDFRVRSIRRRIPTSRAYPGRGPGPWRDMTTEAAYWDFPDEDPPPDYVATGSRQQQDDAVIQMGNDNTVTTTGSSSPYNPNQSIRMHEVQPKLTENEVEVEPPPPYESVCPPTYGEATKP